MSDERKDTGKANIIPNPFEIPYLEHKRLRRLALEEGDVYYVYKGQKRYLSPYELHPVQVRTYKNCYMNMQVQLSEEERLEKRRGRLEDWIRAYENLCDGWSGENIDLELEFMKKRIDSVEMKLKLTPEEKFKPPKRRMPDFSHCRSPFNDGSTESVDPPSLNTSFGSSGSSSDHSKSLSLGIPNLIHSTEACQIDDTI